MRNENGELWAKDFDEGERYSMIPNFFFEFKKETDALAIYTGPVGTFLQRDPNEIANFIKQNLKPNAKLLFDNLMEGQIDHQLNMIYAILRKLPEVSPNNVYYFTGALDADKYHEKFCQSFKIKNKIHINVVNFWEYNLVKHSEVNDREHTIGEKKKTFICFNRMLRTHRLALASLLEEKNLIDKSYYSLFNTGYSENVTFDTVLETALTKCKDNTQKEKIKIGAASLKEKLPLTLTINDPLENANYIKNSDLELFNNSYFSLVTETNFFPIKMGILSDEGNAFFSEKIFKPMLMKHPFVLVGPAYMLEYLKKIGFRTFSPFINEEYDNEEDNMKRLEMIVSEIERLSNQTVEQWVQWEKEVNEIVEHNYTILVTRTKSDYVVERL